MTIFIFWIILSFVAGALGSSRTVGFWGAFFASIILSPIVGFIIVFASRHNDPAPETNNNIPKQTKAVETSTSNSNYIDELKELSKLKEEGVITQDEFTERKINILKKT